MLRLAFLASHNGSNAQAIIDACRSGEIHAAPILLISNNHDSGALERARRAGLLALHLSSRTHSDPQALDAAIAEALTENRIDLLVLAGYMRKLGPITLNRFRGRALNIHPALLPKFGGQGMYGMNVHEAVIKSGEKESGASVHVVTENYDEGPIVGQARVAVEQNDTPQSLAERVLKLEHRLYVDTVSAIAEGKIALPITKGGAH